MVWKCAWHGAWCRLLLLSCRYGDRQHHHCWLTGSALDVLDAGANVQNKTHSPQRSWWGRQTHKQIFTMQGSEYSKREILPGVPGSSGFIAFARWVYFWEWWIPGLGHKGWIGVSSLLRGNWRRGRDQHGNGMIKDEIKHNMFSEATWEKLWGKRSYY